MSNEEKDALVITVQLDGQPHEVQAGTTLAQLVQALGHEQQAISTAVNGAFVARSARDQVLGSGDMVLFFQPVVGG